MNPDELARLEDERRFLLRSIADIDAELAAGDIEADDHQTIRDGYIARAAAVLRQIESGRAALPARRRNPRRSIAIAVATVGFGVIVGLLVAAWSSSRQPGQTISGGLPSDEATQLLAEATRQLDEGDLEGARLTYADVLSIDPGNLEAATYRDWVAVVIASEAGSDGDRAEAIGAARASLSAVADTDPTYADPVCLLVLVEGDERFNPSPDAVAAAGWAERCLALNPPAALRAGVESLLIRLGGAALTTP